MNIALHGRKKNVRKAQKLLAEWRKHDNLTKAQVAERMGLHLRLFLAWKTTSPKPASTH
jgi:transcriptional regulator with XRE-family HTH domain